MRLIYKSCRYFAGLDHSNLSVPIITQAKRNYKIDGANPLDGYLTSNDKAKHLVIMIHEWWGFNSSIVKTADLFSNEKLRVFVPDLYRGAPAKNAQEAEHKMNHLDWGKALQDIKMVKQHFASKGNEVSIMGFCMGGALTFASLASFKGFKNGGVFYGIPDLNTFKIENITAKVIAHFGSQDPLKGFSDPETGKKVQEQAKKKNVQLEVRIWPGVSHAFCNQDSKYFKPKTRDDAFKVTHRLFES